MSKTGILLETDNGEVKAANYGVITAARQTGDNEVVGFCLAGSAGACKASRGATSFPWHWSRESSCRSTSTGR